MPLQAIFIFVLLAVRLAGLDADPPSWLSWSAGLYTDEGFYTLDARHEALFGTWEPGNFHDRLLSPLLSLLQQGDFTLFGIGLVPARLISVAFGLGTVAIFWLGLRRAYGLRVADCGALFLGLAPPFVFYNRMALQETPTVFWLALAFCLWVHGRDGLAGAALALAILFKPLAALALPALAVSVWKDGPRGVGAQYAAPLQKPGWGMAVVLILYAVLWYWPHHAEIARMAAYYRTHQYQPHSIGSLWWNIRRGLTGDKQGWGRGVVSYLLAFLPVPCLLTVGRLRRREPSNTADVFLLTWLVCGLLLCLLSSYAPDRYYVLFLPALAGLAARAFVGLGRPRRMAAASLFLLTSGFWLAKAWADRSYTIHNASQALSRTLPPGSVVVGDIAPVLCLDTRFVAAPIQPGLSNDDHPVERLHATHIAVVRAPVWENWWQAHYPGILQPSHRVATFALGGNRNYIVNVYQVRR